MIKFGIEPGVCTVALLAPRRETRRHMVGIGGALEFGRVAGIALCREPLELSRSCTLVAGLAIDRRMSADEWKAILMIPDRRHRNLPAFDRVTRFAIGAKLAAMDVRVAVSALLANISEN